MSKGITRTEDLTLGRRTWDTVASPTVIVPLGSTEQHGRHLPLDTDTQVARAVAENLAERSARGGGEVLVAPAIAYGSSGEHQDFAGTISIGQEALALLLVEFGRSACVWARRIVFVNGHGGNTDALIKAVLQLRDEGRDAAWLPCSVAPGVRGRDGAPLPRDAHAGRAETSLIAHLSPGDVRSDRVEPGNFESLDNLLPRLRSSGVRAVAANGVLGDPRGASAEEGIALLSVMCDAAWARFEKDQIAINGCLVG